MDFICVSNEKLSRNFKGEVIGNEAKRILCYNTEIGRSRIYRQSFSIIGKKTKAFVFKTEKNAQILCDKINKTYNDDFIVIIKNAEKDLEIKTEINMKVVSNFMEHYYEETRKRIPEKIFLSFFNA